MLRRAKRPQINNTMLCTSVCARVENWDVVNGTSVELWTPEYQKVAVLPLLSHSLQTKSQWSWCKVVVFDHRNTRHIIQKPKHRLASRAKITETLVAVSLSQRILQPYKQIATHKRSYFGLDHERNVRRTIHLRTITLNLEKKQQY